MLITDSIHEAYRLAVCDKCRIKTCGHGAWCLKCYLYADIAMKKYFDIPIPKRT